MPIVVKVAASAGFLSTVPAAFGVPSALRKYAFASGSRDRLLTSAAIDAANATEYGLVAYVYCNDLDRSFGVIESLQTGMIGLNQGLVSYAGAPFGGVKASGFGREGGPEGIGEYLEYKYVAIADRG